jgi:hypothetical protein
MHFFSFILMLLVVGGLGTLVAIGDPQGARVAPYIGFTALFAGLAALSLSLLLLFIGGDLFESETLGGIGFFLGYSFGGLGGAAFGFYRAFERRRRVEAESPEPETLDQCTLVDSTGGSEQIGSEPNPQ